MPLAVLSSAPGGLPSVVAVAIRWEKRCLKSDSSASRVASLTLHNARIGREQSQVHGLVANTSRRHERPQWVKEPEKAFIEARRVMACKCL